VAVVGDDAGRGKHGPPMYFTQDWEAARRSVQKLAALDPDIAATGHGPAMRGERLRLALNWLADHFDELARPYHGRDAREPAGAGAGEDARGPGERAGAVAHWADEAGEAAVGGQAALEEFRQHRHVDVAAAEDEDDLLPREVHRRVPRRRQRHGAAAFDDHLL